MAMQAEPTAEQRAAALAEELPSAEEVQEDVAEYSLPAEVRVATNLILHRVNVQTGGVLTLVPHMESDQYYYDAIIRFCSMEDMCETGGFKDGFLIEDVQDFVTGSASASKGSSSKVRGAARAATASRKL